jgi:hypothetical protein
MSCSSGLLEEPPADGMVNAGLQLTVEQAAQPATLHSGVEPWVVPDDRQLEVSCVTRALGHDESSAWPRREQSALDRVTALDAIAADHQGRGAEAKQCRSSGKDEGYLGAPTASSDETVGAPGDLGPVAASELSRPLLREPHDWAGERDSLHGLNRD